MTSTMARQLPWRVVVVDDADLIRRALADLLTGSGMRVVATAAAAGPGIQVALEHRPDVVLMDVRLPDLDGITAAERLLSADPAVQVVVMSAYDDPVLAESARRRGIFAYLVKGCDGRLFLDTMAAAAERGRGRRALGRGQVGLRG